MFISPWMDKGTLSSYLRAEPHYDALQLTLGIADGLGYLHQHGIIHSDMKSDNVLVSDSGQATICDFGLSRIIEASRSLGRLTSTSKGTTRYMAYELLILGQKNSEKSDVWAFGMIVYEILTQLSPYADCTNDAQVALAIFNGKLPSRPSDFDATTHIDPGISHLLWDICRGCWVQDPQERCSMAEIVKRLQVAQALRLPPLQSEVSGPKRNKVSLNNIPSLSEMYERDHLSMTSDISPMFEPNYAYLDIIAIVQGDITELDVDALVYEPDSYLGNTENVIQGSVSSRLHELAGPRFTTDFKQLSLDYGAVRVTPGHNLFAKHVIHARGPGPVLAHQASLGAGAGNLMQLNACYTRSLELANGSYMKSIAFSSISTHEGEFPIEKAARIALEGTRRFLDRQRTFGALRLSRVIFVVEEASHREAYERLIPLFFPSPRIRITLHRK
ncbi:kinase-like protein [Fomitiporia mediterranea MF3/22]|uniref:kinase-like protein n=1 Tax=Fomitiporia mediterranea (strain MF3/22) TaxID=694068 RepID=UPI0004407C6C|nr:kinase-like protein [Fomitiporia mediterranea MF3/22]EJD00027.1 kinase-like protein [Fomitiporia mediterranea MF3/22]